MTVAYNQTRVRGVCPRAVSGAVAVPGQSRWAHRLGSHLGRAPARPVPAPGSRCSRPACIVTIRQLCVDCSSFRVQDWMMRTFDLTEDQAISFITIACDFGITQVGECSSMAKGRVPPGAHRRECVCEREPPGIQLQTAAVCKQCQCIWRRRRASSCQSYVLPSGCQLISQSGTSIRPCTSRWTSLFCPGAVDGNFGVHAIVPKEPFGYSATTRSTDGAAAPAPAPVPAAASSAQGVVAGALTLLAAAAAAGALLA